MKRTILVLSLLWGLAGTVPASAAVVGENPRLGENFPNTGIGQAAGDVAVNCHRFLAGLASKGRQNVLLPQQQRGLLNKAANTS